MEADWNMIYDQAIYVNVPGMGMQFMANFRYSVDRRVPAEDYHILETGTYEAFLSRCSETMVGVALHDDPEHRIQCWVGYQEVPFTNGQVQENDLFAKDL